MADTVTVQLTNAEYDCGGCEQTHRHSDGEVFEMHADLAVSVKRWIYEEVTN